MRWSVTFALAAASLPAVAQIPQYTNKLAPYVASPVHVVDRIQEDGHNTPRVDSLQKAHEVKSFPTLARAISCVSPPPPPVTCG